MSRSTADSQSVALMNLFKKRQDAFFASLQRFLSVVASDEYIQQMFEDTNSANYVPNRICELITIILRDDRERFLMQVLNRLSSIEACFGSQRAKKLEEIGTRLIEISAMQNKKEAEHRQCIRMLREQLNSLQAELLAKFGAKENEENYLSQLKGNTRDLSRIATDLSQSMRTFQSVMKTSFALAKKKATQTAINALNQAGRIASKNDMELLRQKCEAKINKSNRKLQQAAEIIQQKNEAQMQLENELRNLKKQARYSIKEKDESIENLKHQVEEMKADLRRADQEADQLTQRLNELNRLNQNMQLDLQANQRKYNQAKETIDSLKGSIQQMESSQGKQKKETDSMKKINDDLNNENHKLAENARENEKALKKMQINLENAQKQSEDRLRAIESERDELSKNLRSAEKQNQQLREMQNDHTNRINQQNNQIVQLQSQLEDEEREFVKLKGQAESEIALRDDQISQLSSDSKRLQKMLNDANMEIKRLTATLEDKESSLEQYKEQTQNLSRQIKQNDKQFQIQTEKDTNNHKSELQRLNEHINNLQKEADKQALNLHKAEQDYLDMKTSYQNLQKSYEKEKELRRQDQQTLDQLSQYRDELESQLENCSQQNQQLVNSLESANAKIQREKSHNQNAKSEIQRNQSDISTLKEKLREVQNELKQQMQLFNNVTQDKDSKLQELKDENKKLNKTVKQLTNDNSEKDDNEKQLNEQIEELQKQIKDSENNHQKTKQEMQEKIDENNELIQEKDGQIQQLTNQLQQNQVSLKESVAQISKQKNQLKNAEKVAREQAAAIDDLNNERNELRASLKVTMAELDQQKNIVKQQDEQIRSADNANTELQDELKKIMNERSAAVMQVETINHQKSDMKKELSRSNKSISKLQAQIDNLTNELHKSQQTIQTLEEENHAKEESIRVQKNEIEDDSRQIQMLKNQIVEMQNTLNEAQTLIMQLKDSLADTKSKNSDLKAQIQDVNYQNQQVKDDLVEMQDTAEQLQQNLNAMIRENKNLSRELEKKSLEMDHLKETSKLNETQQYKKITDAQNLIDEIAANCQVHSLTDLPKLVQQLRKTVDENNSTISSLKSAMQVRDGVPGSITEKAKVLADDSAQLNKLKKELDLDDVEDLPQTVKSLRRENQVLKDLQEHLQSAFRPNNAKRSSNQDEDNDDIISGVTNLKDQAEHYGEIVDGLCQILALQNEDAIVETVDQLLRDKNDFERRVSTALGDISQNNSFSGSQSSKSASAPQSILRQISELKQSLGRTKDSSARLARLLQVENDEDIYNAVSEIMTQNADMSNREEQLMITLAADSPDTVLKRIDEQMLELSKYTKILETLANMTQADGPEIVERVQEIIDENNEMKANQREICDMLKLNEDSPTARIQQKLDGLSQSNNILSNLCHLLNVDSFDQLSPAVSALLDSNQQYNDLNGLFPDDLSYTNIDEKITKLINENIRLKAQLAKIADLLRTDENKIEKAVLDLMQNLKDSSQLFSQLLGVLSSAPLNIKFPLSKSIKERLLALVSEFKAKTEASQKQIDSIMSRAQTLGYTGSSVVEAVDFIAAAFGESEKQRSMEKMHQELMDVRAVAQKEQGVAEKQLNKAKKKNAELRQTISAAQEKAASREEEMLQEIEELKEKMRKMQDDLIGEQKIHEELVRYLGGQAADSDYLRTKLDEKEVALLNKAEKTRKLIEQMNAKNQENEQILQLQKKNREDIMAKAGLS